MLKRKLALKMRNITAYLHADESNTVGHRNCMMQKRERCWMTSLSREKTCPSTCGDLDVKEEQQAHSHVQRKKTGKRTDPLIGLRKQLWSIRRFIFYSFYLLRKTEVRIQLIEGMGRGIRCVKRNKIRNIIYLSGNRFFFKKCSKGPPDVIDYAFNVKTNPCMKALQKIPCICVFSFSQKQLCR